MAAAEEQAGKTLPETNAAPPPPRSRPSPSVVTHHTTHMHVTDRPLIQPHSAVRSSVCLSLGLACFSLCLFYLSVSSVCVSSVN
mmetsp:Transcript_7643/g.18701  ORF Transcript_7643/g.18701 Transcript_7643/m.18701 type:complete len:84 (-) Transcript_7643:313-564(-)